MSTAVFLRRSWSLAIAGVLAMQMAATAEEATRQTYDVAVERDVMVPMRDGTRLATDLYIPTKDGKPLQDIPAVLLRTSYGKHSWGMGRDMFRFFAKHGYLSVTQDVRVCFRAEGSLVWHQQEAKDGYDAIEWLARHPLCNGRVGTHGPSYMCSAQLAAATQTPPSLATIIPHNGDLLAHWKSETDKDGFLTDSSPNDCRLKREGVSLEPGRGGNVLRCGHGGAVASVPGPFFHPGGVTVSLWCKPSERAQNDRWMLNTVGRGAEGYRLGLGGAHPVWQVPQTAWSHGLRGPNPLPVGQWSHVAATFDNQTMRLYVNGREVATKERHGFIHPADSITIGAHSAAMDRARFRGRLDDVQV